MTNKLCPKKILSAGILLVFICSKSIAQCCSGGVPMAGNLGLPQVDMNTWQFSLNYDLNVLKTFQSGVDKFQENGRQRNTHSTLLQIGYTFSKRLSADIFLAFIRQERRISNPGLSDDFQYTNGLGDGVFLLKYNVTASSVEYFNWTIGVGSKIPLGASNLKNEGILMSADLQPGSGSWDGVFYNYISHQPAFRRSISLNATAIYRSTGVNDDFRLGQSYKFGNELQLIIRVGDQLVISETLISPTIGLRYRTVKGDAADNNVIPNTGGEWIFVNPTLGINLSKKLSVNLSIELPLFADVSGTQLTPTYRLNTGLYYLLSSKKNI